MVFWIAAGMMIVMAVFIYRMIPQEKPAFKGTYRELLNSLFRLIATEPLARQSAWIGACTFGAISAFWSTMAFFLEKPPYSYTLSVIGMFGMVGLAGSLVSPLVGNINDKRGPSIPMKIGILIMLCGYGILFLSTYHLIIIIIGIILIDVGLQSAHIPNLTRVSSLVPSARTRLNTIYMTSFFIGGTLGSIGGSLAWSRYGWPGVCTVGILFVLAASIPVYFKRKTQNSNS